MNKKRITALLLSAVLMLTSVNFAFAENVADSAVSSDNTAEELLDTDEYRALYAMGYVGAEMGVSKKADVTRANFIGYLFKLSGYVLSEHKTADIPFKDVSIETPYYNEICTMYEKGIVSGTEDDIFSPDAPVTYAQACKLIIDVLGYTGYVAIKYGVYPDGYVAMATELDLNDGVKNTDPTSNLAAEDAATMLYNAGFAEVMFFAGINDFGTPTYETNGKNLFSRTDVYFDEGVMQSNGIVSIVSENATDGITVIGGENYTSSDVDLSDLLGCRIKYFYSDKDGEKKLLWGYVNSRFNDIVELNAYDLATDDSDYSLTNIVYYESDGDKDSLKVKEMATIVYNNSLYSIPTEDLVKPKTGTMRLIDTNDDEVYDTVIVEEFKNIFVSYIGSATNSIVDKYNNTLDLDKYKKVKIIKNGKEIEFTQIASNSLISYVENKDKTSIYIYVMNDKSEGKLQSMKKKRGRYEYTFENGTYRISSEYNERVSAYLDAQEGAQESSAVYAVVPKVGSTYIVWFDMAGEIAEVQEPRTALQYALLMSAYPGEGEDTGTVHTRLLMTDGSKTSGITKKKLIIDGEKKDAMSLMNHVSLKSDDGEVKEQVVMVAFDDEGYLKEIKFAKKCTDSEAYPYGYNINEFSLDYASNKQIRNTSGYYMIDNRYIFSEESVIFVKWNNLNDTEPYSAVRRTGTGTGNIQIELYDAGSDMVVPVAYIPTKFNADSNWLGRMIVDEVETVYEDGMALKRVTGYTEGDYTSVTEIDEGIIPDGLNKGDIIKIAHYKNKATKVIKEFAIENFLEDRTPRYLYGSTNPDAYECARYVPIYSASSYGVTTINPDEWVSAYGKLSTAGYIGGYQLMVVVYDSENDELYQGDVHDIYQKYSPNSDGTMPNEDELTMAYIHTSYCGLRRIMIII